MSWAIERDKNGQPIRMWWMGHKSEKGPREIVSKPRCSCGFTDGWHKFGCEHLTAPTKGEKA